MAGEQRRGTRSGSFYGGVVSQTDPDRPRGARTELYCRHCREFFPHKEFVAGICPGCGGHQPGYNPAARKRILDDHLNRQAAHAHANR